MKKWEVLWKGHKITAENKWMEERLLVDGSVVRQHSGISLAPVALKAEIQGQDGMVHKIKAKIGNLNSPWKTGCYIFGDGQLLAGDTAQIKLGDDERRLQEYYHMGSSDSSMRTTVLTNKRLIIASKNTEESYPLSKITAIKIGYKRLWGMVVIGAITCLIGLGLLSTFFGFVLVSTGLPFLYYGWMGKTKVVINQMGGEQSYSVWGNDEEFREFMDAVKQQMS